MHYDEECSSSTGIASLNEKLSNDEKINILIDHLELLSKKYGLGDVKFWYEPFSDGYKMFSVQICPDHSDDERIEVLDKITDENVYISDDFSESEVFANELSKKF